MTKKINKPLQQVTLTEDEFYEKYNPVKNHLKLDAAFDGQMFETYGEELQYIHDLNNINGSFRRTIWTIIEAEGKLYYNSGYHYVNRLGYLVTKEQVPENKEILVELEGVEEEIEEKL